MKHQKILNLFNTANDSKFVTGKWNTVNSQSSADYGVGKEIICNTEIYNLIFVITTMLTF